MKYLLFTTTCFFTLLTGCQSKMAASSATQTNTNTNTITGTTTGQIDSVTALKKVEWDTSGGGNLHYTLSQDPDHAGQYLIQLTALRFETREEQIVISADEVHLHNRIDALFGGRLKITERPVDQNSRSGSFSQVTLYNALGVQAIYKRPVILNRGAENLFEEIRTFIEANLNPEIKDEHPLTINTDCNKLSTLEGTWLSTEKEGTQTTNIISTIRKIQTNDGTEQFTGTDDKIVSGCFGDTTTTQDVHYVLDRSACVITQQVNQTIQTFKILSVGKMGRKSAFKMALCKDSSCTQVSNKAGIMIRQEY